jgi:hypothetical protein
MYRWKTILLWETITDFIALEKVMSIGRDTGMRLTVNDIYEQLQDTDVIQKGRVGYEKDVQAVTVELLSGEIVSEEEIRDKLYALTTEAESAGFSAGFRSGIELLMDCLYRHDSGTCDLLKNLNDL